MGTSSRAPVAEMSISLTSGTSAVLTEERSSDLRLFPLLQPPGFFEVYGGGVQPVYFLVAEETNAGLGGVPPDEFGDFLDFDTAEQQLEMLRQDISAGMLTRAPVGEISTSRTSPIAPS